MSAVGFFLAGFGLGLLGVGAVVGSEAMKAARWLRPHLAVGVALLSLAICAYLAAFLTIFSSGLEVGFGVIVASGLATVVKLSTYQMGNARANRARNQRWS